jgi:hypothetical protein
MTKRRRFIWVVDPQHVRKNAEALHAFRQDSERLAEAARKRMAAFDKLPRAVRLAVHEHGALAAAVNCKSRKAADKIKAMHDDREKLFARTAVKLEV